MYVSVCKTRHILKIEKHHVIVRGIKYWTGGRADDDCIKPFTKQIFFCPQGDILKYDASCAVSLSEWKLNEKFLKYI